MSALARPSPIIIAAVGVLHVDTAVLLRAVLSVSLHRRDRRACPRNGALTNAGADGHSG